MKLFMFVVTFFVTLSSFASVVCPSNSKTLLSCKSTRVAAIQSAVLCIDHNGNMAIKVKFNRNDVSDFLPVREIPRMSSTGYMGNNYSLLFESNKYTDNAKFYFSTEREDFSATLTCN